MSDKVSLNKVYKKSPDIVVRNISGKVIVIPLNKKEADIEEAFFSFNRTGCAVWEKINGKDTLKDIAAALAPRYGIKPQAIEKDIIGLVEELKNKGMLLEA